jgi:Mn-containing catalase
MIHQGMVAPQFFVGSAGGPAYTNSQGVPWTAAYINGDCQGDLSADLRSDIGAETRAKMVYEYLLQFTTDPYVQETLHFLMAREVAHYQMFEAALATIQPNFPPGVLQSDPRYSNLYFNMSSGNDFRGPWNSGESTVFGETLQYIDDPIQHVLDTNGLLDQEPSGTDRTAAGVETMDRDMSRKRSSEIIESTKSGVQAWNDEVVLRNVRTEDNEGNQPDHIQSGKPSDKKVATKTNGKRPGTDKESKKTTNSKNHR